MLNLCLGLSKRTAGTPTYLYYVSSMKNLTRKSWPGKTTFSLMITKDKAPTPGREKTPTAHLGGGAEAGGRSCQLFILAGGIIKGRDTTVKPHLRQFFPHGGILTDLHRLAFVEDGLAHSSSRSSSKAYGCAACRWSSDHPPATYSTAEKMVQITASSITTSEAISR